MSIALEVSNYVGIIAFAVSGSLKAVKKGMDLLGVLVLGFVTALGGGIISDVLLGKVPPVNLTYYPYPLVAFASSLVTFFLADKIERLNHALIYADALGLSAFAVSGASLAYSVDSNFLLVISVGTITAVGGGVIRDLMANEVPMVLTREFYATAAILGSTAYFALRELGLSDAVTSTIAFSLTLALRLLAIRYRLELPRAKLGS